MENIDSYVDFVKDQIALVVGHVKTEDGARKWEENKHKTITPPRKPK
jgi:hypothetical protein